MDYVSVHVNGRGSNLRKIVVSRECSSAFSRHGRSALSSSRSRSKLERGHALDPDSATRTSGCVRREPCIVVVPVIQHVWMLMFRHLAGARRLRRLES